MSLNTSTLGVRVIHLCLQIYTGRLQAGVPRDWNVNYVNKVVTYTYV